jgi:serine/threonine protein kinase
MERLPEDPLQLGPYTILGRLGQGGMGVVFKGESPNGKYVAIKMASQSVVENDPFFLERFQREVEATKAAGAHLAPQVVDSDFDAPLPWYASQFIDGTTLQMAVKKEPLDAATACKLGIRLAGALRSIHAEGIVHGDLTPKNIIMSDEDGPMIIDFGIASLRRYETDPTSDADRGIVWGTAGYISPEQLNGGKATPASDIYALGAVLFFATTQQLPFPGASSNVLNDRTRGDEKLNLSAVPLPLKRTVAGCLKRQPGMRPSSRDVVESLVYDRRELLTPYERIQNHGSAQLQPTARELIPPDIQVKSGLASAIDLREPLLALSLRATQLAQKIQASVLAIDFRAVLVRVLRALATACVAVLEAPVPVRVLMAAMVISAAPGYSLLHSVHGWGGILLAAAVLVIVVIALAAEWVERSDSPEEDGRVTFGLAALGWFFSGLCAFILTLISFEATWWKRILLAAGISLLVGFLLGAVVAISFGAEEIRSAPIGIGWGMLIAVVVTTVLNWGAAAGLGWSIGWGLISLVVVSVFVTLLLLDE